MEANAAIAVILTQLIKGVSAKTIRATRISIPKNPALGIPDDIKSNIHFHIEASIYHAMKWLERAEIVGGTK